jgi:hypothetical protein
MGPPNSLQRSSPRRPPQIQPGRKRARVILCNIAVAPESKKRLLKVNSKPYSCILGPQLSECVIIQRSAKMRSSPSIQYAWRIALAIAALLISGAPAFAGISWTWDYKCSLGSTGTKCDGGSGTFTTSDLQGSGVNAYYLVTAITGTVEKNTITSLLAPGSLNTENDNKISISGAPWANAGSKVTGIGFLTDNDPATHANVNLLFSIFIDDFVGYLTQISGPDKLALESVNFDSKKVSSIDDPVTVSEPGNLLYFAAGLLILGLTVRIGRPSKA